MKESYIENYLVRKVKENNGLCLKFVSPGNPGVPDRIVITPDGRTIYVELNGGWQACQNSEMAKERTGETGRGCPCTFWDGCRERIFEGGF